MIYLDEAATTKPKDEVIKAMMPYMNILWYNPSALYNPAKTVKKEVDRARKTIADFINCKPEEIIFTSGGSESNCTAIQGFISYCKSKGVTPSIITTTIEHKSIIDCVDTIVDELYYVSVDNQGYVDMKMLASILDSIDKSHKVLVSIQFANNEIGTIQHIKKISDLVHSYNAIFHTDAIQAFGHEVIDVKNLGIDMLSASGHKIGAVKGIGFLYKKSDVKINPIIYGSQENGMRGGTENVPYIIGLAKAVELIGNNIVEKELKISFLRNEFITKLRGLGCTVNGSLSNRLANNISVTFPQFITGEALIYMLDLCGVYISAGSACNSHSIKPSYVLQAIGLSEEVINKTIRITINEDINTSDIDNVIYEIKKQIKLLEGK